MSRSSFLLLVMVVVFPSLQCMTPFDSTAATVRLFNDYANAKGENILHTLASVKIPAHDDALQMAAACINGGVALNAKTATKKRTPLHYAAITGRDKLIELFLKNDTSQLVNEADRDGNTALHFAIKNKDIVTVYQLLLHGANVSLLNNQGKRPIRLIIEDSVHNKSVDQNCTKGIRSWAITNDIIRLICLYMTQTDLIEELVFARSLDVRPEVKLFYKLNVLQLLQEEYVEEDRITDNYLVSRSANIMNAYSNKAEALYRRDRLVEEKELISVEDRKFHQIFNRNFRKEPVRQTESVAFLPSLSSHSNPFDGVKRGQLVSVPLKERVVLHDAAIISSPVPKPVEAIMLPAEVEQRELREATRPAERSQRKVGGLQQARTRTPYERSSTGARQVAKNPSINNQAQNNQNINVSEMNRNISDMRFDFDKGEVLTWRPTNFVAQGNVGNYFIAENQSRTLTFDRVYFTTAEDGSARQLNRSINK